MRHELKVFTSIMEHKLALNDHKGGFEDGDPKALLILLEHEVAELKQSIEDGDYFEILTEAADVANFAMILAWRVLLKTTNPDEEEKREMP